MGISCEKPEWAIEILDKEGLRPDKSMDNEQASWWSWFTCDNDYYNDLAYDAPGGIDVCKRLSLRPARMVADEIPSLVMTSETTISSDDASMNKWIDGRMHGFIEASADFISLAFALGSGCWAVSLAGGEASIVPYHAWQMVPVRNGMALLAHTTIAGERLDQLQVHALDHETGTWHIRTRLFEPSSHREVSVDEVNPDYDTLQELPTYAVVRPSKANTHELYSPLGVSIYEDAIDSIRMVDEAFNQLFWQVRVSLPRVFFDEQGVRRDSKTGEADWAGSVDQVVFRPMQTASGSMPVTVYNPSTHVSDMVDALNCALSTLGLKCGFGQQYWSFDLASGLKTATEVVSANSVLMRTIRRNEKLIGGAIDDVARAAYSCESALSGAAPADVPHVRIDWDDSVMTDDKADRDMMKDDISRGLCPRWMYLVAYYGMDEAKARAFTGEAEGGASQAALDASLGLA
ncbi:phage portal protein [Enorma sp.]|uniref:phage portal protein n=1 Tax=Enorma sp. TaxID=1920692 RepID=UPI0025BFFAC8|nr:phage portal protein [Enorma sp.]